MEIVFVWEVLLVLPARTVLFYEKEWTNICLTIDFGTLISSRYQISRSSEDGGCSQGNESPSSFLNFRTVRMSMKSGAIHTEKEIKKKKKKENKEDKKE